MALFIGVSDETGVTTGIRPLPAHRRMSQFRRLLGRSTAREGVLFFYKTYHNVTLMTVRGQFAHPNRLFRGAHDERRIRWGSWS
jgi:hypothetical protein